MSSDRHAVEIRTRSSETSPPVTVVIPCFNPLPSVFRETLHSVLRSTLANIEMLIVDDGSKNKDFLKVLSAVGANRRISVIAHPQNRGLSAARNTGAEHSRTPYFLQLDSDDLAEPTFIEKCVWALNRLPGGAVVALYLRLRAHVKERLYHNHLLLGTKLLPLLHRLRGHRSERETAANR